MDNIKNKYKNQLLEEGMTLEDYYTRRAFYGFFGQKGGYTPSEDVPDLEVFNPDVEDFESFEPILNCRSSARREFEAEILPSISKELLEYSLFGLESIKDEEIS